MPYQKQKVISLKPYNFNSEFFSGDLLKKYIDMTYKRHQNYLKIKLGVDTNVQKIYLGGSPERV